MSVKEEDRPVSRSSKPLDSGEAAEWLGVQRDTLGTWRYLGKGPKFYRVGSRIRYFEEDLRAFLVEGEAA